MAQAPLPPAPRGDHVFFLPVLGLFLAFSGLGTRGKRFLGPVSPPVHLSRGRGTQTGPIYDLFWGSGAGNLHFSQVFGGSRGAPKPHFFWGAFKKGWHPREVKFGPIWVPRPLDRCTGGEKGPRNRFPLLPRRKNAKKGPKLLKKIKVRNVFYVWQPFCWYPSTLFCADKLAKSQPRRARPTPRAFRWCSRACAAILCRQPQPSRGAAR